MPCIIPAQRYSISIHSLRVEGDLFPSLYPLRCLIISIHSLRVEGDFSPCRRKQYACNFNPLPPCGGRPSPSFLMVHKGVISIHSLRVEGD